MEKLYIIKIGGNIIDDESALQSFLHSYANIAGNKILVHGGGKLASRVAEAMGISQQLIDGRRITDGETLKVVTMVYAGYINKNIVARLQSFGCNAIGFSGPDGNVISARKRIHASIDYGYVGDIENVNAALLQQLLDGDMFPVLAPITHDNAGTLLNTNADSIAQEVANALAKYFETCLIYCFEKNGVLTDVNDPHSVVSKLDRAGYETMKAQKQIAAGMIPKLDNAFAALDNNVKNIMIGNAADLELLLLQKAGTTVTND